jgi:hypothetical protein
MSDSKSSFILPTLLSREKRHGRSLGERPLTRFPVPTKLGAGRKPTYQGAHVMHHFPLHLGSAESWNRSCPYRSLKQTAKIPPGFSFPMRPETRVRCVMIPGPAVTRIAAELPKNRAGRVRHRAVLPLRVALTSRMDRGRLRPLLRTGPIVIRWESTAVGSFPENRANSRTPGKKR